MLRKVVTLLSAVLMVIGGLYVSNALEFLGIHITIVPYCALILMLVLVLVFLIFPAKGGPGKEKLPWYDIALITMSVCGSGYITFFPGRWEPLLVRGTTTLFEVILCLMLVIAILEATRRTVNLSMALIASFFLIHLVFGSHFPGIFLTFDFTLERIAGIFYLRAEGIFGTPVEIACTIVLAFMLFSAILQNSEAGRSILDGAFALTGRWKGGPAKAAILGSAALGTMVGATAANIATTGSITIPLMKKTGYSPVFAGGVEAVASNGGQIMPPVMGAVAFLIAELLSMPYWSVCVAAFLPAALYFLAIFVQVHFEAVRLGLRGLPPEELPSFGKVFKEGWYYLIPVLLLVYLLAKLHLPVQHCGFYASMAAMLIVIINWQRKKETRKGVKGLVVWFIACLETAARALLVPAVACASAGIIIGSLDSSGLGFRLSSILVDASGGSLFLLLVLTAIASFILGMGMTSIPCYLVLVILVAPALVHLGVVPIAAHLFVFYWGLISFLTPPVAVAAYVACGISGGHPMRTGFIAMRLGVVKYIVPFLFVYSPSLLLMGPIGKITIALITGIIGVTILSIGLEGFLLKPITVLERLLFIVGGSLALIPADKSWEIMAAGITLSIMSWEIMAAGIILSTLAVYLHVKSARGAALQV
ncbi:MAG: TRAP transporter fused permease subunit [Deltaproteobacteria bacterium]|nr:MAG: TRAP transporter fused permease subunit [Deltaproteobacteria bacterium]